MTPDRQFSDPRLADLYDLGNAGSDDRDYYLSLASAPPQDILDLGCGTGLLCLEYAARGHRVTGVDPARAMLDVGQRAERGREIEWVESTAERFRTENRFDLIIMTGHAFQVLLLDDEVLAAIQTMARHLKPDGLVAFESRNPNVDWDTVWSRDYVMQTKHGPVKAVRRMTDRSRAPEYLSFAWDYYFREETITSESTLRFLGVEAIEEFARKHGLHLKAVFGDWYGGDFDSSTSREMIFQFWLNGPERKK